MLRQAELIYEFGSFRLNIAAKLFLKENRPVQLNPKTFELLVVLVQRRGCLVGKEELLQELWPDSFVEEGNLTQNIYLLRKALGEDAHGDVYIKTVPRRGYRFVAEVREVPDDLQNLVDQAQCAHDTAPVEEEKEAPSEVIGQEEPPGSLLPAPVYASGRRWGMSLTAVALATVLLAVLAFAWYGDRIKLTQKTASATRIAVLPFKTIGPGSENELLGLGMADAIIVRLSNLQQLPVLPTSTIIKYTGREHASLAVGHELGVDTVLDGTIQRSEDHIRVTVQLIRVNDGRTIWSEVYDEKFTNIFAMQDVISKHVAEALQPDLSREEKAQLTRRHTDNTQAYDAYVRGLYFWNKRSEEGLMKALEYFQQAVEKDPEFALAYAGLADTYAVIGYYRYRLLSFDEAHYKAKATAMRALELDEKIAEAHTVMAVVKEVYEKDDMGAELEHKRALALNPNSALAHLRYSIFLNHHNRHDEGFEELHRARSLDPLSAVINFNIAFVFFFRGDYEQAVEYSRKALETEPDYTQPLVLLGMVDVKKGLYTEALAHFTKARSTATGGPYLFATEWLGYTYAAMGRREEAQDVLLEIDRLEKENKAAQYSKITILARLGRMNEAFKLLDQAVEGLTWVPYWFKFDPRFDKIRSDPGYKEFMQRHKFSE